MTDRHRLKSRLNVMLKRIVVLSNHLRDDVEPNANYVDEKMNTVPVLDATNRAFYNKLREQIYAFYGVMLEG